MVETSPIDATGPQLLASDSGEAWSALVAAARPASLLVAIDLRIGVHLRPHVDAEDIWQEALAHAWRERAKFEWRGIRAFRRWLLQCAENCIRSTVDRLATARRGGGAAPARVDSLAGRSSGDRSPVGAAIVSATPSRHAMNRERVEQMRSALDSLPPDEREVIRLRMFEDLGAEETAQRLGISLSAVKRRLRRGVDLLGHRLQHLRDSAESRT